MVRCVGHQEGDSLDELSEGGGVGLGRQSEEEITMELSDDAAQRA